MFTLAYTIRLAGISDIDYLVHHRRAMFYEMGHTDAFGLDAMETACRSYLATALNDGGYRSWIAENSSGQVIAGGAIVISPWPGNPSDQRPLRAMILNMYTEPGYRRKGIARALMATMISWCREQGFQTVALHASDEGRPLYESLGFKPTNEMRLSLR
jgi:GNAT superfamily N-acetyltransferase